MGHPRERGPGTRATVEFPMLELPALAQESIYHHLDAADRVRLNMAMPKDAKFPCDKARDKKLGVLATAIRKKRVRQLSRPMREFLATVPKTDVTWECVNREFAEAKDIEFVADPPLSLYERKRLNQLTLADLPRIQEMTLESSTYFFAGVSPEFFGELYGDDSGRKFLMTLFAEYEVVQRFAFYVVTDLNDTLLTHILLCAASYDGLNLSMVRTHLQDERHYRVNILLSRTQTAQILLRHFTYSQAVIIEVYDAALEAFDVDRMLLYEKYLLPV